MFENAQKFPILHSLLNDPAYDDDLKLGCRHQGVAEQEGQRGEGCREGQAGQGEEEQEGFYFKVGSLFVNTRLNSSNFVLPFLFESHLTFWLVLISAVSLYRLRSCCSLCGCSLDSFRALLLHHWKIPSQASFLWTLPRSSHPALVPTSLLPLS